MSTWVNKLSLYIVVSSSSYVLRDFRLSYKKIPWWTVVSASVFQRRELHQKLINVDLWEEWWYVYFIVAFVRLKTVRLILKACKKVLFSTNNTFFVYYSSCMVVYFTSRKINPENCPPQSCAPLTFTKN